MEYHVVLTVEQENFAFGRAQFASQVLCELYGGEPPTDDDHYDWLHFISPVAQSRRRVPWPLPILQ
jgi:hypothetical protein